MKLDKIRFARVIHFIGSRLNANYLNDEFMADLDSMIDIDVPVQVAYPSANDVERLMALMAEGTRKIEAIKMHRTLTGMGLKESKDTVERYWVAKPASVAEAS